METADVARLRRQIGDLRARGLRGMADKLEAEHGLGPSRWRRSARAALTPDAAAGGFVGGAAYYAPIFAALGVVQGARLARGRTPFNPYPNGFDLEMDSDYGDDEEEDDGWLWPRSPLAAASFLLLGPPAIAACVSLGFAGGLVGGACWGCCEGAERAFRGDWGHRLSPEDRKY